jgi:hypothetical protein
VCIGCTAKSKLAMKAVKSGRIVVHMLERGKKFLLVTKLMWKSFSKYKILAWKIVHIKCHGQCGVCG